MGLVELKAYIAGCREKAKAEDDRAILIAKSIRTMTFYLYNIQLEKKDRIEEQELWHLPGDVPQPKKAIRLISKSEGQTIANRYKELGLIS
jgi:hypothetical protein